VSARGFGDHETDELIAAEPGLERVVTALTADGDATELVGRQAALTMFRTVRDAQAAPAPSSATPVTASPGGPDPKAARRPRVRRTPKTPHAPGSPRMRESLRMPFPVVVATAASLVAVCAAATAAAYIAALPTPVQQIAHSVFAPLGIPTAPPPAPQSPGQGSGPASSGTGGRQGPAGPGSSASSVPPGSSGPGASTRPSTGVTSAPGASPTASASGSPTASPTAGSPPPGAPALTLAAASTHVAPGGQDTFTAQLTQDGQPVTQISVRLVEHDAGAAGLHVAAAGVTGADGTVTLAATGLTVNATFHVEATAQLSTVASPKVTVEVIPSIVVHLSTAATLMVRALAPAAPGDAAILQQLSGGVWVDVTTRALGPQGRATFPVVPGQAYRVALRATITHGRAVSAPVKA
jgi:hypothetical protein